jgi:heme/copper-type cytochrome/quinol oxidase subunit 2
MRGKVVVDKESDYQAWLQGQQTFAQSSGPSGQSSETNAPAKSALE